MPVLWRRLVNFLARIVRHPHCRHLQRGCRRLLLYRSTIGIAVAEPMTSVLFD